MENYTCPLCQKQVERDLAVFLEHSETHIIDAIKKEHPDWVDEEGVCEPCLEYYRKQLKGQ